MTWHIGILGAGNISDTHARAALAIKEVEIAAVYGENTAKAERLASTYGGRPYRDLGAFLSHRPMDLVAIGSPSGCHVSHVIACARAGLHVLVEKPLGLTTAEVDRMVEECERARMRLGVFYQDRCQPGTYSSGSQHSNFLRQLAINLIPYGVSAERARCHECSRCGD